MVVYGFNTSELNKLPAKRATFLVLTR